MKVLLDTSVFVAGFLEGHVHFPRARPWVEATLGGEHESIVAAHTLVEIYSTLTRMPPPSRIGPADAHGYVEWIAERSRVAFLAAEGTRDVLRRMRSLGLGGGLTYDALVAAIAAREDVELLLTFNDTHFRRVWPEGGERIRRP